MDKTLDNGFSVSYTIVHIIMLMLLRRSIIKKLKQQRSYEKYQQINIKVKGTTLVRDAQHIRC